MIMMNTYTRHNHASTLTEVWEDTRVHGAQVPLHLVHKGVALVASRVDDGREGFMVKVVVLLQPVQDSMDDA